jgi:putative ABC transport system permease protein
VTLFKDIVFAVRAIARNPGFATVVILTLGVGIGLCVAVWSVIDGVLIDPLPFPDADRLVELKMTEPGREFPGVPMSSLDYRDHEQRNQTFQAMAATFRENVNLTGGASPQRVPGVWVSAAFFEVIGVPPQLGRGFLPEEDAPGSDLVAVVSHGLWQRRFAGDPDILGSKVVVNGRPHVVVGVTPEGFSFPRDSSIWLPIAIDWNEEYRGHGWVVPYGRIRPDVTFDEAEADLDRITSWQQREYPDTNKDRGVRIDRVKETIVGPVRSPLMFLMVAVACVLFIAAANVTILLSVRAVARQRELTLRQALGARRVQLVRLLLAESVFLSLIGGAFGLGLAHLGLRAASLRYAELIPRSGEIAFDPGVLGFALVVSIATGLLVGLLPVLRAREERIMQRLRAAERSVAGGGPVVGTALVVAEITIAVVLLASAALLIRTFVNLLQVDPGFESRRVLTAEVALTDERYREESDRVEFYRRAESDLASLPGVSAAGTVYPLPLHGRRVSTSVYVEGSPDPGPVARQPLVDLRFVSPGYLDAARLRLVAGRFIQASDTADAPQVVVVNESFVRQLVPQGDPVGRLTTGDDHDDADAEWQTIVGVVENVRHIDLAEDSGPEMYVPVAQFGFEWATFVVRAESGPAESLADPIRETVRRIDPELPVFNVRSLDDVVQRSIGTTRFLTSLLLLFGATGLALAGVGVFSVVSYSVSRRLREMAIRLALGGSPGDVMALVMRQGLIPVAAGVGLGLTTSLASMRLVSSRLYGVTAYDMASYAVVTLLILGIAALATWLPARRATRVEPMTVLRTE